MTTEETKFMWNGKHIETLGDLMKALENLTQKEAPAFRKAAYEAGGEVCLANIGYAIGYFSTQTIRERLARWLDVKHPVFGAQPVTSQEAFDMGVKLGHQIRKDAQDVRH